MSVEVLPVGEFATAMRRTYQRVIGNPEAISADGKTSLKTRIAISRQPSTRAGRPVVAIIATVVAMLLAFWALLIKEGRRVQEATANPSATAVVARRSFVRMLRLHGTVEAIHAYTVTAPQLAGPAQSGPGGGALIITKLVRSGQMVRRGDLLAEFDRQTQIKNALDRQAEYRDLEEQIKKKQAEHTAARAKDETELEQAGNAVEVAKLEMQKNEVIARINAEKNKLTLEEATARWKQLKETFELKRRAAQAEVRVLEIQRDRARDAMHYTQSNAEKMSIRAPQDGLTVVSTVWNNQKEQMAEVQEGEEVRPGSPVLQVVNPTGMQIRVRVNQADLTHLQIGQPAQVILDAYPDSSFPSRLEQVAPVGITSNFSDKVHTFVSLFLVQASDPRLIPDLSAAVEVQLERRPDVLVVPRDAVTVENGQSFVQVKNSSGLERRPVKTGPVSDWEIVIESGVTAGTVLLRNIAESSNRT